MSNFKVSHVVARFLLLATMPFVATLHIGFAQEPSFPQPTSVQPNSPDKSKGSEISNEAASARRKPEESERASAILAGGCFWCVETDFEKLPGVVNVISGYTGGRTKNPTYENYATGGHREAVFVMYDPSQVSYAGLVEFLIKHIDPTNRTGSFNDRGRQYSPAIYYENDQEKLEAERVIKAIDAAKVYAKKIAVDIEQREPFWIAEDYHQDYHSKNGLKYTFYRSQSGRDAFVEKHWGQRANVLELPGAIPESALVSISQGSSASDADKPWENFEKPDVTELRKQLNGLQFKVTQQEGTEPAFRNTYWKNKEQGIYVDVVSGEPLFTSADKYESGTGWPSFVKPIDPNYIIYKEDRGLFSVRTEVRSRFGDSHLGHVFSDGPVERGGKRYCMNSAAMRFISKDKMKEEGYGAYLKFLEDGK
jgi:peptide methionine sulfoxide reductase msrA/msrB